MPEETPQAEAQAPAGAGQQVDADALRTQMREEVLKEFKAPYEEQIGTWKKKYGDESNAWGKKYKAQEDTIADLKAQVEAAKLSEDGVDFVARKRGLDQREIAFEQRSKERETVLEQRERESQAALAISGIRRELGDRIPADWYEKAKARILSGEVFVTTELVWEAQRLAAQGGRPQQPGQPTGLSTGRSESVTKDNIDKLHLEGKLPGGDEAYRKFLQTGQV